LVLSNATERQTSTSSATKPDIKGIYGPRTFSVRYVVSCSQTRRPRLTKYQGAALSELIAAAVKHQLRRPLDLEECRLPLGKETRDVTDRHSAIVAEILRRPDLVPQPDGYTYSEVETTAVNN
jgi:hypothetical protein